ncbi:MAG TPA: T9SS type A sorting domain-containing protein [Flavobacterium sp.]|jgi:hypothetical protein|nr:T9SS type A sorting domain-containing protein [Flavobacterium sp.]HRZ73864.1 T9SS type A sorting domain-containing protein [Flavobacterium sp.]
MKTTLKTVLLLFFTTSCFSQIYYSNYLDETSEWREISKMVNQAGAYYFTFSTRFFEGFENINGFTYYKMYKTKYTKGYYIGDYSPFFISDEETSFLGFVREDNSGKFYTGTSNGNENLFFENQLVIDAQIGDSFSTLNVYSAFGQESSCTIENISFISLSGMNLKVVSDENENSLIKGATVIEGIGRVYPYCESPQILDNVISNDQERIFCYTKQGQIYQYENDYNLFDMVLNCDSFPNPNRQGLSVSNFNTNAIQIFPNPTTSTINIKINKENIISIQLFDVEGRVLEDINGNESSFQFDLSNYRNGTYLVKVITERGSKVVKILKI